MSIVCGTDFTPASAEAATAAAAIASKRRTPLVLVHASDTGAPEPRLDAEAARLRSLGAEVEPVLARGSAHERIVETAAARKAALVVVASVGQRGAAQWLLGSVAELVVRESTVPVLVVRGSHSIVEWAARAKLLRVLLAVEPSDDSAAAASWVKSLRDSGPVEVVLAHAYWPPRECQRLHIDASRDAAERKREVERVLAAELAARFDPILGAGTARLRLVAGFGRPADHVILLAVEEKADLIAIGSHQRRGIDRLWYGSVSYGVIQLAPISVVCVPSGAAKKA